MKVTEIRIDVVRREVPSLRLNDQRRQMGGTFEHGVLRVVTDDGIEGNCTVGQRGGGARDLMDQIVREAGPLIVRHDPADREWLWARVNQMTGNGEALSAAWSCVDVALWDIAGKAAGMPVHALLGTHRREVAVYATYPPRQSTPEGYAAEAEELKSQGFTAYKVHPGAMPAQDVCRMVDAVRDVKREKGLE